MLNGDEALLYSRYRGGPDGDFGRTRRQQQVIRSFLESTADLDFGTGIREVLRGLQDHTRTDMSVEELITLASGFRDICTAKTSGFDMLTGTSSLVYDEVYQRNLSMVLVTPEEIRSKVAWLLNG